MKNHITIALIVLTFLLLSTSAFAGPSAPPQTPIDGGLGILLGAGALWGYRKLKRSKRS